MTNTQAAERQAMLTSMRAMPLRPETIERLQSVLKSIDDVHKMGPREIGRLQWKAFCALTDLQVDLKISDQEH